MSLVSFTRASENTIDSMKQAIREALRLIDYSFGREKRKVVIKPNLCYYWDYSTGQTTDPRLVAALIKLIREQTPRNTDIFIVESDASAMKCKHAFRMLGYEKMSRDCGAKLVNLSEDKSYPTYVRVGAHSFFLMVPRTIKEADLRINVPKIKYMARSGSKITCALKNIYGCNPYPKKSHYHSRLAETIVAINKAMNFNLCVTDGITVSGIHPRRLGLVMASTDPVAIDVAAAKIAGENPMGIQYIRLAHREGLGNTAIIQKGEQLDCFKAGYPRKDTKTKLQEKAFSLAGHLGLARRLGME